MIKTLESKNLQNTNGQDKPKKQPVGSISVRIPKEMSTNEKLILDIKNNDLKSNYSNSSGNNNDNNNNEYKCSCGNDNNDDKDDKNNSNKFFDNNNNESNNKSYD